MAEVVSDWLCICAAGSAIDGRKVDDAWLKQVADNYDREKYTAMIWPQHHDDIEWRQWSYNFGSVDSLKYEVENGIGKLYARLVPNEFLLNTNREKQKLFTSAEFWPDFASTGEWYLSGLAVTDVPASLYTDKLQFSATNKSDSILRSEPLTFSLGQVSPRKSSLINRLFSFTPKTPEKTDDKKSTQESEPMNEELKALLTELLAKVNTIDEKAEGEGVDTPEEAAEEIAELAEEIAEAVEDVQEIATEIAENPEDEVLKAEFSIANKHLEKLVLTYSAKMSGKKGSRRERRTLLTARDQRQIDRAARKAERSKQTKIATQSNGLETSVSDDDKVQLTALFNTAIEKLSALETGRKTPVISGAPSGEKKTTIA